MPHKLAPFKQITTELREYTITFKDATQIKLIFDEECVVVGNGKGVIERGEKTFQIAKGYSTQKGVVLENITQRQLALEKHLGKHDNLGLITNIIKRDGQPDIAIRKKGDTNFGRILLSHSLTTHHIQYFLYCTIRGLVYLHSAGVVHGNLYWDLVDATSDDDIFINDFSNSVPLPSDCANPDLEQIAIMLTQMYGNSQDIYTFEHPYALHLNIITDVDARNLFRCLLSTNYTAIEALRHPFFRVLHDDSDIVKCESHFDWAAWGM